MTQNKNGLFTLISSCREPLLLLPAAWDSLAAPSCLPDPMTSQLHDDNKQMSRRDKPTTSQKLLQQLLCGQEEDPRLPSSEMQ